MQSNKQASPLGISGRDLRRARNVVKKWTARSHVVGLHPDDQEIAAAIHQKRYERACALILADKLRNS